MGPALCVCVYVCVSVCVTHAQRRHQCASLLGRVGGADIGLQKGAGFDEILANDWGTEGEEALVRELH